MQGEQSPHQDTRITVATGKSAGKSKRESQITFTGKSPLISLGEFLREENKSEGQQQPPLPGSTHRSWTMSGSGRRYQRCSFARGPPCARRSPAIAAKRRSAVSREGHGKRQPAAACPPRGFSTQQPQHVTGTHVSRRALPGTCFSFAKGVWKGKTDICFQLASTSTAAKQKGFILF